MVEACRKYGCPLAVGQQYRYSPINQTVRRLIADGVIGDPFLGSLDHVFLSDNGSVDWLQRVDRYLIGGMVIHYLDLFRFLLADEADTVYAKAGQAPFRRYMAGSLKSDHWCIITVTFKRGAVIQFFCSEDTKGGTVRWNERYHMAGTTGAIFVDTHDPDKLQVYRDATGLREPVPIDAAPGSDPDPGKGSGANTLLLLEYLDCIDKGVPSPTSGADHLKSLAIAEAAYRSAAAGQPVKVDALLPPPLTG
jgi:predicted dehydrogenase